MFLGSIILSERVRNYDIIRNKLNNYPDFNINIKIPGEKDLKTDMKHVGFYLEKETSGLDYVFLCRTNKHQHTIELYLTPLVESA